MWKHKKRKNNLLRRSKSRQHVSPEVLESRVLMTATNVVPASGELIQLEGVAEPEIVEQSATLNGDTYVVSTNQKVLFRASHQADWQQLAHPPVTDIAAENGGIYLLTGQGDIYFGAGAQFSKITGDRITTMVAENNSVYALTATGDIYRHYGYGMNWEKITGDVIMTMVAENNSVYALTASGDIYRHYGYGMNWEKITGDHITTMIAENNSVYALTATGDVYRHFGHANAWDKITGDHITKLVNASDGVHALTTAGQLYRHSGESDRWSLLKNHVSDFDYLEGLTITMQDGVLYIEGTSGNDRIELHRNNERVHIRSFRHSLGIHSDLPKTWVMPRWVEVYGKGGNDILINASVLSPVALHGGDGNDILSGLNDSDVLYGEGGNDILEGSSSIDVIHVAGGVLTIEGTPGNDQIELHRNNGRVHIRGHLAATGNHSDLNRTWSMPTRIVLKGAAGNDTLINASVLSQVTIHGGVGNDTLKGLNSSDALFGEKGNDKLNGFDSIDALYVENQTLHLQKANGEWKHMKSVVGVLMDVDQLQVQRTDGSWEVTYTDLPTELRNSIEGTRNDSSMRSIVGNLLTTTDINRTYQNGAGQVAANTLIDATVRITMTGTNKFGSGVLLDRGGNQFVLTADHVVNGFNTVLVNFNTQTPVQGTVIARTADLGNRDLALIRLNTAVAGVQGAIIEPFYEGSLGSELLLAGYGLDGADLAANLNFGFSRVDGIRDTGVSDYIGRFAEFTLDDPSTEVVTAAGDSGGPAMLPFASIQDGSTVWIPVLTAIHHGGQYFDANGNGRQDAGEIPQPGHSTLSTIIDASVINLLQALIPSTQQNPTLRLDSIEIFNDGDGITNNVGEWHLYVDINGLTHDLGIFHFADNILPDATYDLSWIEFPVGDLTESGTFTFWGVEEDSGFFNTDDPIQRWAFSFDLTTLPSRTLFNTPRTILTSEVQDSGKTSYQLTVSIG